MKSDTAISEFLEKYDEKALQSIDELSHRFAPNVKKQKISLLNLQECFSNFENYIKGYAQYKAENVNNKDASPQSAIYEKTQQYVSNVLNGKNIDVYYSEIPSFVKSYTEGIKSLNETIDDAKHIMEMADVDQLSIGNVNDFVDQFVSVVTEAYDNIMEKLLWSSGYMSNGILLEGKKDPRKKEDPVFL